MTVACVFPAAPIDAIEAPDHFAGQAVLHSSWASAASRKEFEFNARDARHFSRKRCASLADSFRVELFLGKTGMCEDDMMPCLG